MFKSKDGADILISIQSDREWRVLVERVLGDPALAADPSFASNVARVQNRAETDRRVGSAFAAMPLDQLMQKLAAAEIAFARVNGPAELASHPHLRRIAGGDAERTRGLSGAGAAIGRGGAALWQSAGAGRAHG